MFVLNLYRLFEIYLAHNGVEIALLLFECYLRKIYGLILGTEHSHIFGIKPPAHYAKFSPFDSRSITNCLTDGFNFVI